MWHILIFMSQIKRKRRTTQKYWRYKKKINAFCPSCISTSERVICNHHHHRRNWNWKTHSWLDKWIVNFGIVFTMTPHTFRPGILFIFFFPTPIGKVNQSASVRYIFCCLSVIVFRILLLYYQTLHSVSVRCLRNNLKRQFK